MSNDNNIKTAGPWGVRYAYLYLTFLILAPLTGVAYAAYAGWINPSVSVSLNAELGWIMEYAIAALVALFILWTFAQVVRVTGFGFIKKTTRFATDLMDGYSKEDFDELTGDGGEESDE